MKVITFIVVAVCSLVFLLPLPVGTQPQSGEQVTCYTFLKGATDDPGGSLCPEVSEVMGIAYPRVDPTSGAKSREAIRDALNTAYPGSTSESANREYKLIIDPPFPPEIVCCEITTFEVQFGMEKQKIVVVQLITELPL